MHIAKSVKAVSDSSKLVSLGYKFPRMYILGNLYPKETNLELSLTAFTLFAICMMGCGINCWYLGRKVGIQYAVDYLVDNGHLDVDDEVEISD